MRFDDTNPAKESSEFEQVGEILANLQKKKKGTSIEEKLHTDTNRKAESQCFRHLCVRVR